MATGPVFEIKLLLDPPEAAVRVVAEVLSKAFRGVTRVENLGSIPRQFFDRMRGQYRGLEVLIWLSTTRKYPDSVVVAVINSDAYVSGLNFIFGVADPRVGAATVYLHRLHYFSRGEEHFLERLRKEVIHEVGHVFGLKHCSNPRCVMRFSNSIWDTDAKTWKYCRKCASLLKERVPLSEEFIL